MLVYGMMVNTNASVLQQVAKEYQNVYAVSLSRSAQGHPLIAERQKAGTQLTEFLRSILG